MLYDPCTSPLYMLLVLFLHYFQRWNVREFPGNGKAPSYIPDSQHSYHHVLSVVTFMYMGNVSTVVCVWITFFHCIDLLTLLLSS